MSAASDVVVIGSGFGGAVAAARLVETGARVTLLERGPWRDTVPVREAGVAARAPLPAGARFPRYALRGVSGPSGALSLEPRGLYDIHYQRELTVVCSSGVGGGSHVYTAALTPPVRDDFWDGHDERLDAAGMAAHYDWFAERFPSRPVEPSDRVANWPPVHPDDEELFDTDVTQPPMAFRYDLNSYRNNAFTGSADGAKRTLDTEFIAPAVDRGLQVLALHEALQIAREGRGYRLRAYDHAHGRYRYLRCDRVVLAAGALNSLKLLFASRASGGLTGMPALGTGLGGNGDVLAWWAQHRRDVDYTLGTPAHGRIRLRGGGPESFMLRVGMNGADDIPLPARLRTYLGQNALLVAMGVDRANGVAVWRRGRLRFHYDQQANPVLSEIATAFRQLAEQSGQRVWQLPPGRGLTVHLHGGARLGAHPATSVVNWRGEVHDNPGLFVADASALPGAVGGPPSMTIAAWGGHVAHELGRDQPGFASIRHDGRTRTGAARE